jgi:hypothetical protein
MDDLITATFPVHDPPVAWRVTEGIGAIVPVVCCPAIPDDDPHLGYFDFPVLLDAEPGHR